MRFFDVLRSSKQPAARRVRRAIGLQLEACEERKLTAGLVSATPVDLSVPAVVSILPDTTQGSMTTLAAANDPPANPPTTPPPTTPPSNPPAAPVPPLLGGPSWG